MKRIWSNKWVSSTQRRKQRKYRHNAPMHVRHKFVSAALAGPLRKQYSKRSVPVCKGDEVEVMRGSKRKLKGTVERVDLSACKVYIEGLTVKKPDGSEVMRPFHPSNLKITKIKLDDKRRQAVFERTKKTVEAKKTETKKETNGKKAEKKQETKTDAHKSKPAKKAEKPREAAKKGGK